MSEPLTAEEEASIRLALDSPNCPYTEYEVNLARTLFATLDAARAAITREGGEPAWGSDLACHCQRRHRELCWDHKHRFEDATAGTLGDLLCEPHGHNEARTHVPHGSTQVEGGERLREAAIERALTAFYETHIALVYKSEKGRREALTGQRGRHGRESWRRQVQAALRAALSSPLPEDPKP